MMTFDEYQAKAITTDAYGGGQQPLGSEAFYNKILGLCGESGEVADKFKKIFRNNDGKMSAEERELILKELGDVLWYINAITTYMGASLGDIAKLNLEKLLDRKARNVIKSTGDTR